MRRFLILLLLVLLSVSLPLSAIAKKPAQKLKDTVRSYKDHDATVEEILNQGPNAIPDLMALLNEQQQSVRFDRHAAKRQHRAKVTAMALLSEFKSKKALPLLTHILETSDDLSSINNAAKAIGNIGGEKAYRILKKALKKAQKGQYKDANTERKRAIILALGLCDNKKAIPLLQQALKNKKNDLRTQLYAAGSLGLLGAKDGLDIANEGLNASDPGITMAATRALGAIGAETSIDTLTPLTHPLIPYTHRKTATAAIAQIEAAQLSEDAKTKYIEKKLETHPKSTELIQWGTQKLKKIKTKKARKALERFSHLKDPKHTALKQASQLRFKTIDY